MLLGEGLVIATHAEEAALELADFANGMNCCGVSQLKSLYFLPWGYERGTGVSDVWRLTAVRDETTLEARGCGSVHDGEIM